MHPVVVAALLQLVVVSVFGVSRAPDPTIFVPVGVAVMGVTMAALTIAIS
jgi:hypothetical protein